MCVEMCCHSLYLEAGRQLVGVGSPSTPMWVPGIKLTQVFSLGNKYLDTLSLPLFPMAFLNVLGCFIQSILYVFLHVSM